jgi:hypothetical protein
MQLLALIALAGFATFCVVAYAKAVTRINRKAEARYGIRPISWGRCFLMVVPYASVFLGILMDRGNPNHNLIAGLIVAALVTAGVFWWIKVKTDAITGAVSIGLLALAGLILAGTILFVVYLVLLCLGSGGTRQERHRREG